MSSVVLLLCISMMWASLHAFTWNSIKVSSPGTVINSLPITLYLYWSEVPMCSKTRIRNQGIDKLDHDITITFDYLIRGRSESFQMVFI